VVLVYIRWCFCSEEHLDGGDSMIARNSTEGGFVQALFFEREKICLGQFQKILSLFLTSKS
jgi:hypothetical protein